MYTYYTKAESPFHYLYAGELAQEYGIYTVNGKPHAQLIAAYLDAIEKEEGAKPLFYATKHGLHRVYPHGEEDTAALLDELCHHPGEIKTITLPNGRTFKLKLKEAGL